MNILKAQTFTVQCTLPLNSYNRKYPNIFVPMYPNIGVHWDTSWGKVKHLILR